MPIGKAAMIDTDCRFASVPSEKINAIGKRINKTAQNTLMNFPFSSSERIVLYE